MSGGTPAGITVGDVAEFLDRFAPPPLAEDWDNTGLLLGDSASPVASALTCLTLTADVADEAIRRGVALIVTHHPVMFRPLQRLTTATREGAVLWRLARAGVAVYSPHTRFDSAAEGINASIAAKLGLVSPSPIEPQAGLAAGGVGRGRIGELVPAVAFPEFAANVKAAFASDRVEVVPTPRIVRKVAVGCGAGMSLFDAAVTAGCDAFVTGEARFHSALEARSAGIGLVLLGHYASERFALEDLAVRLRREFPSADVRPSESERDPITVL